MDSGQWSEQLRESIHNQLKLKAPFGFNMIVTHNYEFVAWLPQGIKG